MAAAVALVLSACTAAGQDVTESVTWDAAGAAACEAWQRAASENLSPERLIGRIADVRELASGSKVNRVRTAAVALHAAVDDAEAGRIAPFSKAALELHAACDALRT